MTDTQHTAVMIMKKPLALVLGATGASGFFMIITAVC